VLMRQGCYGQLVLAIVYFSGYGPSHKIKLIFGASRNHLR
jgi:hypothetical protein